MRSRGRRGLCRACWREKGPVGKPIDPWALLAQALSGGGEDRFQSVQSLGRLPHL
ncbi:MAG: hypothetical protein ACM359_17610 [Bacillota bacterium]